MQPITMKSYIGSDGLLQLQLPDELKNQDVTVIIQIQKTEWLSILQNTAGIIPDLKRPSQGEYEVREFLWFIFSILMLVFITWNLLIHPLFAN